jgi:hypothetical protein
VAQPDEPDLRAVGRIVSEGRCAERRVEESLAWRWRSPIWEGPSYLFRLRLDLEAGRCGQKRWNPDWSRLQNRGLKPVGVRCLNGKLAWATAVRAAGMDTTVRWRVTAISVARVRLRRRFAAADPRAGAASATLALPGGEHLRRTA